MTYIENFGLSEPPFSDTPDPRFIYPHSSYKEALATLQYGIEGRKGFILVSGRAGTGKTTLLRMLIRSLDPSASIALISRPPTDYIELLHTILNDLQLPSIADDRRIMMGQLNQFLIQELRGRRIVSLLVDNAHQLSDVLLEEIRLLSNLETNKVKLLQIALLGQPQLETKLERPELWQLKQRLVLRYSLQPLGSSEVGSYIRARLHAGGCGHRDLFLPEAVEAVAAYSKGMPQVINAICDNALATAWAASTKEISLTLVEQVVRHLQLDTEPQKKHEPLRLDTAPAQHLRVFFGSGDLDVTAEPWQRPVHWCERYRRRTVSARGYLTSSPWLGVGILFALVALLGGSLLAYSRDIGNSLWKLPAKVRTDGVRAQQLEATPPPVQPNISAERPYPTGRANEDPSMARVRPRFNAIADEKYDRTEEEIAAPVAKTNEADPASDRSNGRADAPTQKTASAPEARVPPAQGARPKAKSRERTEARERFFDVVASSFVRDKPQSDANIIATLEPGTRVRLIAQRGEYFEVSWLNHTVARGYVHREDAFFEPIRNEPTSSRSTITNRR